MNKDLFKSITKVVFGIATSLMVFSGCVRFEQFTLEESTEVEAASNPSSIFIDHFDQLGWQWWTTEKIKIAAYKGILILETNKVGPDWGCFGKNLNGSIDASKYPVVKIRARVESGNKSPEIQVTLRDGTKFETNGNPGRTRFKPDGLFHEYYINMSERWFQTWPNKRTVNPTDITDVLIFINPGGRPYTGKIEIDYIELIPLAMMPEGGDIIPFDGIVDIFDEKSIRWWYTDSVEVEVEDNALKVWSVGSWFGNKETIGKRFAPIDFTKNPVVKIRAKLPAQNSPLRLRILLEDSKQNATDSIPMEIELLPDGQYKDYYYDYAGKFLQLSSSKGVENQKVDPKDIVQMLVKPNPTGLPYKGQFYIDEVKVLPYDSIPAGILSK